MCEKTIQMNIGLWDLGTKKTSWAYEFQHNPFKFSIAHLLETD